MHIIAALFVSSPQPTPKSLMFAVGALNSNLLLVTNHTELFWHV